MADDEVIDHFGQLSFVPDDRLQRGDVWMGVGTPSQRLIDAFARGETTEGGLAEAGWRILGTMLE